MAITPLLLINLTAPEFFRGLYRESSPVLLHYGKDSLDRIIDRWGLPDSCLETVAQAYFLHLLLKDHGLLGVRYITMNQRPGHLFMRKDGDWVSLDSLWVRGHAITQRASAVDRVPRLFWGDLLHDDTLPLYLYCDGLDSFYLNSFGWCSELEMAYVVGLSWFGIGARVIHYWPNHVMTGVRVGEREFLVDNSFSYFMDWEWKGEKPYPPDVADRETKRLSRWYNARAREGIAESRRWQIGVLAQRRIRRCLRMR